MFRRNRDRVTQRLSGSTYSLTTPGGRRVLPWVLSAILLVICVFAYGWLQKPPTVQSHAELERLQQQVGQLQQQLRLAELRLQQEVATREGLAHQMDAQSQKLGQTEQELQFFRGQKDKSGRGKVLTAP
jgi:hypothetical protein